jgi:hypothetical protein
MGAKVRFIHLTPSPLAGQHALKTEQLRVWVLKVPYAVKGNRKNFQFKT